MGILSGIKGFLGVGRDIAEPIEAVGNIFDKLFTSDDEKLTHEEIKIRLFQQPKLAQVELNKVEAQHKSLFVAGWRPFCGYVCGTGLLFSFIVNPLIQWVTGEPGPQLPTDIMMELIVAMLGLSGLRTIERLNGRTK